MPRYSLRAVFVFLALAYGVGPLTQTVAADSQYFAATNICVRGSFLDYWRAHRALTLHGYPLTTEYVERLEDGETCTVQYFERARMELPDDQTSVTIAELTLGRLEHTLLGTR